MRILDFYLHDVLPRIAPAQRREFAARYPHVHLEPADESIRVTELPVLMLVALTGTGKSTTLAVLAAQRAVRGIHYDDWLPARRDLANMVVIPAAQVLLGEAVAPVYDRVQRFRYTRAFAEHVPGGLAAAFALLHLNHKPDHVLVSEGIRGAGEIAFTLERCHRWHVMELVIDPVLRLKRLSSRRDSFDRVGGACDFGFLPLELRAEAAEALASGDISPAALAIVRAEAENYGVTGYPGRHLRYSCAQVDDLGPGEVAGMVAARLRGMVIHA